MLTDENKLSAICPQSKGWFRPPNSDAAYCLDCGRNYSDFRNIQRHSPQPDPEMLELFADIEGGKPEDYQDFQMQNLKIVLEEYQDAD